MHFWAKMKFGGLDHTIYTTESGLRVKDLYTLTLNTFQDPDYGLILAFIYLIAMIAIAFHLIHGFASGFQSLGVNHPKYNGFIRKFGYGFSILIPLGFAIHPFLYSLCITK
jgi:succinate dehydrogenase / fumarate reductase, cytochrome b subunit